MKGEGIIKENEENGRKVEEKGGGMRISKVGCPVNSSSPLGKMADVSKDKLRKEITAILKNADLSKMSAKKVRQTLEEKLEVDLTDQKKVVDDLVMEFLEKKTGGKKGKKGDSEEDEDGGEEENGGADGEDDEEEDDEKEKKKPQKRSAPKNNKGSDSEGDEEDEDDEEEYGSKKKAKTSAKKAGGKKKKKGSDNDSDEDWGKNKKKGGGGAKKGGGGGGKGGGYTKPCTLSPELAKLVGKDTMPRHEVVKKVWAIIKERNLYDPDNKQFAICDNDLMKVMGVKRFRTFGMMKYLKNHIHT